MNVLGVGAPAPTSLSSSALHFRLKVTNILPPSPIYHSRTVYLYLGFETEIRYKKDCWVESTRTRAER